MDFKWQSNALAENKSFLWVRIFILMAVSHLYTTLIIYIYIYIIVFILDGNHHQVIRTLVYPCGGTGVIGTTTQWQDRPTQGRWSWLVRRDPTVAVKKLYIYKSIREFLYRATGLEIRWVFVRFLLPYVEVATTEIT